MRTHESRRDTLTGNVRQNDPHKLEICIQNARLGSMTVQRRIARAFPHIDQKRWACIGYCDTCAAAPCALIDDHLLLQATTPDALYTQVLEAIDQDTIPDERSHFAKQQSGQVNSTRPPD